MQQDRYILVITMEQGNFCTAQPNISWQLMSLFNLLTVQLELCNCYQTSSSDTRRDCTFKYIPPCRQNLQVLGIGIIISLKHLPHKCLQKESILQIEMIRDDSGRWIPIRNRVTSASNPLIWPTGTWARNIIWPEISSSEVRNGGGVKPSLPPRSWGHWHLESHFK